MNSIEARILLGRQFRRSRRRLKMTMRQCAERIGSNQGTISLVERGLVKNPSAKVIWSLCLVYNIDMSTLYDYMIKL